MEYEIPNPPEDGDVQDENGNVYRRADPAGDYWFSEDNPKVRGTYAWHDLLWQRGPVRSA